MNSGVWRFGRLQIGLQIGGCVAQPEGMCCMWWLTLFLFLAEKAYHKCNPECNSYLQLFYDFPISGPRFNPLVEKLVAGRISTG